MKLERLHLKNFRCFDDLIIEFDPRLTVIVGQNGAGKTAILDAIAIGFGRYLSKLPGITGRGTKETDIRVTRGERRSPYMMLGWEALKADGEPLRWSSGKKGNSSVNLSVASTLLLNSLTDTQLTLIKIKMKEVDKFTLGLVDDDLEQRDYVLPVIAYYGTNRAIWEEVKRRRGFKKNFTRFDALAGALEPDSRFRAAFEWFNAMEDVERREREKRRDFDFLLFELEVVRKAIVRMLGEAFSKPRTEIRPLRFVIDWQGPDGKTRTLRLSQLSDGYRVILGLTMDFARRMAQANGKPVNNNLTPENPLDLPAIALIDEVDLHLHPSWQQRVLSDLMNTFTNTQFIVTTHSPQVLSTVKRENILVLAPNINGQLSADVPLAMTYGEPSGDVMHSVMMVDPLPPVKERADLNRLTELVDQGQYEAQEAKQLMIKLEKLLGRHNSQLQRLQRSIKRQQILKT